MRQKILCLFICIFSNAWSDWRVVRIGTCPDGSSEEIEVGDGRNDGINRIYVASPGGHVYEWTYSGNSWNCETILSQATTIVTVGEGRSDGVNRVYAGTHFGSGNLTELSFSSGNWTTSSLEYANIHTLRIGDGRNDGTLRVYAGGGGRTKEWSWTGDDWTSLSIASFTCAHMGIGKGRNDGKNRLYLPDRYGQFYEYTWNGNSYDQEIINLPETNLTAAIVGQGRNDGKERIYVAGANGHLYEVTYTSKGWEVLDMTPSGPNRSRYSLRVGKTRKDGKFRVYATTQGVGVYEYSWNGSSYEDSLIVDATTGATACLAIGEGRNDDTVRIYVTSYRSGAIYEVTNTDPYIKVEENTKIKDYELKLLSPNPLASLVEICFVVGENSVPAKLRVYDITGSLITTLKKVNKPGTYWVKWNWMDESKNRLPSGIYFYRLEGKGFNLSKKIILLK
jgi:hypothetical protein